MLNVLLDHPNGSIRQHLTTLLSAQGCRVTQVDASSPVALLPRWESQLVFLPAPATASGESLRPYLDGQRGMPLVILVQNSEATAGPAASVATAAHIRLGAFDTVRVPVAEEDLQSILWKAQQFIQARRLMCLGNDALSAADELLGSSAPMQTLRQLVRKVARTEATVLIHGEPGSGKSLTARLLHSQSGRAQQPFIGFDCWRLPSGRAMQELFGTETQAWQASSTGLLRQASHSTVLLDEVAELSSAAQSQLLEFLKQPATRPDAVRLLVSTSRSLETQISCGAFNEELFFRLNILPIEVPPLRARVEDIPMLADHFRHLATRKYGIEILAISADALRLLQEYSWPGNVRELQTSVEKAVLAVTDGALLEPHHFTNLGSSSSVSATRSTTLVFPTLGELEKQHIFAALERCDDNRTHAAKLLGISIRTLRNKLREYRQLDAQVQTPTAAAAA